MKTLVIKRNVRERIPKVWLEKWVKALSKGLAKRGFRGTSRLDLVVVFTNSKEMRKLNRHYRQKDYATDVLSFAPTDPSCLGELVLCPSVLKGQARGTGLPVRGELGYMMVHGALHLLGYDHEDAKGEKEMFALQDSLFAELSKNIGFR